MTSDTIAKPKIAPAVGLPKAYPIHPQIVMKDRGLMFCCKSFVILLFFILVIYANHYYNEYSTKDVVQT